MSDLVSVGRLAVTALAIGSAAGMTAYLWQWRSFSSAQPLLGLAAAMLAAMGVHLVVVYLSGPDAVMQVTEATVDEELQFILMLDFIVLIGGAWVLFVLQYTGRARWLLRAFVAIFGTLLLVSVATTVAFVRRGESTQLLTATTNVVSIFVVALIAVGVILMVTVSVRQNPFPFREPLVLSAGAVVLAVGAVVLGVLGQPVVIPATVVVAVGLFVQGVSGPPTFEMLPAVHVAGRDRIIEQMSDAVIVIDREEYVRDLNPAGAELFGLDRSEALGRPLSDILQLPVELSSVTAERQVQVTVDGRTLAVTANRVTDERDRLFGYLLVCRDVTERQARERRLAVLNNLLVRAVRDRMMAVADDAARLESGDGVEPGDGVESGDSELAPTGERIWTTTTDLAALVASAREVERAIAESRTEQRSSRADVRAEVTELVDQWADTDGLTVSVAEPEESAVATISPRLLQAALEVLLESASRVGTEAVEFRVSVTETEPEIRVGTAATATGSSGPMETESMGQLGVAVARLAIEHAGGTVTVTETDGERHIRIRLQPGTGGPDSASENLSATVGTETETEGQERDSR